MGTELVLSVKIDGLVVNKVIAIGTAAAIRMDSAWRSTRGFACVSSFISCAERSQEASLLLGSGG